jgi:hypothetical protein
VTVAYGTSTDGGSADLVVDGNVVRTISFAGSTKKPAFGSTVTIGDLAEGTHELKVVLRSGGGYIDGFTVAACQSPAANAAASTTSSSTTTSRAELAALTGVLVKTVEVGSGTETLSVIVTSSSSPVTVNILNPLGTVVASGQALLAGSLLSGIDASSPAAGLYSVQVVNSSGSRQTVEVSIARTIRR